MASRGTAAVRRRQGGAPAEAAPAPADALLALVARALGLDRAAILARDAADAPLVAVALHGVAALAPVADGEEPGGGPWSAVLPFADGLLLLARPAGAPLAPDDVALASALAECAAGVVAHGRMAADRDHTRELLARADRLAALGTLAAGVAHEIRNPLVSVRTFIQLLPERLHDEEFRTGFRELALDEIERICALINDLLAFSRPAPVEREPTDLNEVTGQIVHLLDAEARRHDVGLAFTPDPALPPVVIDDAQIKQVLMNVILNAIQACGAHGRVEVTTAACEDGCVVTIADTGPGIDAGDRERVFEPFFTTKDAGSGLGLFIARQIVDDHGGRLSVEEGAGGGAVFALRLPLVRGGGDAGEP